MVSSDPHPRDKVVDAFVTEIVRLHELLAKRGENLEPCLEVNLLFDELIGLCLQILPEQTTRDVSSPNFECCTPNNYSQLNFAQRFYEIPKSPQ